MPKTSKNRRSYRELRRLQTYEERLEYLQIGARVGDVTFGSHRRLNQIFYTSPEWKAARDKVIIRDSGCDLGIADREIHDHIYIHHINPITEQEILDRSPTLFDPDNLICTSRRTHEAIHYGDKDLAIKLPTERTPNDMCPWR